MIDSPTSIPAPVLLLLTFEKHQRWCNGRMSPVIAQCSEHLEATSGQVGSTRIQQRMVIGKRDVVEDNAIVILIIGAPPTVGSMHREHPIGTSPDGVLHFTCLGHSDLR